jgi:hypothetical protein
MLINLHKPINEGQNAKMFMDSCPVTIMLLFQMKNVVIIIIIIT